MVNIPTFFGTDNKSGKEVFSMKILILSFKAGEGHNSAAKAVLERAKAEGHEAEIVDFIGLFSNGISNAVNSLYVSIATHTPYLFGALYHFSLWLSRCFHKIRSILYLDSTIISKRLKKYLEVNGPYDAIVATHLMPAQALSHLKRHHYPLPVTIAITTDYTVYPYWDEVRDCDYCIIPHEDLTPEFVRYRYPVEKLRPFGIPIRAAFSNLPTREAARAALGFSEDVPLYLVMGGSMGAGMMKTFAKKMAEKLGNAHMTIVCGKNKKLKAQLDKVFSGTTNVHVLGFTDRIPEYMMASDVLFTKPGGLTSSELLACRIPTVHTAPIPGCESANFRFFAEHGCTLPAKKPRHQVECGLRLMNNPDLREQLRQAQAACAKPDSALRIIRLAEKAYDKAQKEKA